MSKTLGQLHPKPIGPSAGSCARARRRTRPTRARLAIEIDRATLDGLMMLAVELRAQGHVVSLARLAGDMVADVVADDLAAHAEDDEARH